MSFVTDNYSFTFIYRKHLPNVWIKKMIFFTSFSCNLPMAPLIFAEKANFGFFLSGAGNFIIDTFLKENDVVLWVG